MKKERKEHEKTFKYSIKVKRLIYTQKSNAYLQFNKRYFIIFNVI